MVEISPEQLIILIGSIKRNVAKEERKELYKDVVRIFQKKSLQVCQGMDKVLDQLIIL